MVVVLSVSCMEIKQPEKEHHATAAAGTLRPLTAEPAPLAALAPGLRCGERGGQLLREPERESAGESGPASPRAAMPGCAIRATTGARSQDGSRGAAEGG